MICYLQTTPKVFTNVFVIYMLQYVNCDIIPSSHDGFYCYSELLGSITSFSKGVLGGWHMIGVVL